MEQVNTRTSKSFPEEKQKCPRCTINLVVRISAATVIRVCYKCGFETRTRLAHE